MIGHVREKIKHIGIIAVMNNDFPVQEIIEVSDALLASPILVMAISLNSSNALDAIAELRRRHGEHMLIGAGDAMNVAQVDGAWRHDAQFLITTGFVSEVVEQAHRRGLLIAPGVESDADVQKAAELGCRMVHYHPADANGVSKLAQLAAHHPHMDFVAGGGVDVQNVADFAQAGAAAVSIGNRHTPHVAWSAAALITRTRTLRAAWVAGCRREQTIERGKDGKDE